MRVMKKWIAIALIFSFFSMSAFSQDLTSGLAVSKELGSGRMGSGSEFVSGDYPGAVLMRVNLWGAVGKPGIHFVPAQTDLVTLLSFAGGPSEAAKMSGLYIKRWTSGKEFVIEVNAE